MEFRTRHMSLVGYVGLAILIIAKDIVTEPLQVIALLAPIAGMFTWDKYSDSKGKKK